MVISEAAVREVVSRLSGVAEEDVDRVFTAFKLVCAFGVYCEQGIATPLGILSRNRDGGVDLVMEYLSDAQDVFIKEKAIEELVERMLVSE